VQEYTNPALLNGACGSVPAEYYVLSSPVLERSRSNRPCYGSVCLSVRLSVCPVQAPNSQTKRRIQKS